MPELVLLCLLLLQTRVHGFGILGGDSLNHQDITERAILNVTVQVCRAVALAEGKDFTFPPQPFTSASVAAACEAPKSSKSFSRSICQIKKANWRTDIRHVFNAHFHFDGETFIEGRKLITEGLYAIKAANKKQDFSSASSKLGRILHTLQDFYSHSNWVEMGYKLPNANLIRADTSIGNIAAKSRATCRNCDGNDCMNNILEDVLQQKILTSGYFGIFSSVKPTGKCSHGDSFDATRKSEPTGGINKDRLTSSHGHLHIEAASLAIAATSELLQDIRGAAGDRQFLQMMGINKGSSTALCFVVDTTGSMADEITAVKTVTSSIIDSKVGTEDEPSSYILVPFSDPDFGPLIRTTDPKVFKNYINSLTATGGGDFPEKIFSGLQLALTGAPSHSEIFVFTDASAKDKYLKNTVIALIEQTKAVVNFMITNGLGFRSRRQGGNDQRQENRRKARLDVQLYRDLAQVSGGQVIEVPKDQLLKTTSIITESPFQVTLLQASRSPGKAENFVFTVDESVRNLTIYITGSSADFTLIDPSGEHQNITSTTGSSNTSSQMVGNLKTLHLPTKVGEWVMGVKSTNPYSLRVVGESPIDFLFDFLRESQGLLEGFDLVDNRPTAGGNGSLMVTLTGSDSATVTEVTLVESSGSGQVNGSVEARGGGEFFVRFDRIPSAEFVVLVKGQNSISRASSGIFQRQSTTSLRASTLTVTAEDSDMILEPGTPHSVHFSVMTSGTGRTFTIQAANDQGFNLTFPSTLSLDIGGSANGTVNLTTPLNTPSGTGVTLTIAAVAPGGVETNYDVLRFIVLPTVTDFTQPQCQLLSLQSSCSDNCSQSMWELSVQVTDGAEGTGVDHISLREGNGILNTSMAAGSDNITLVSYTASCCLPDVQLVVVDGVGNVETCRFSARTNVTQVETTISPPDPTTAGVPSLSTRVFQSFYLCLGVAVFGLSLSSEMGVN